MVLAPQFDYLASLPAPTSVESMDYDTIFAGMIARAKAALPDFAGAADDPLYRWIQQEAYFQFLIRQSTNARLRSAYRQYARGDDLDNLVAFAGLERQDGETDEELDLRYRTTLLGLSAGTLEGIRADALGAGVGVDDVDIAIDATGQTATVYAAKDQAGLTTAEQATLLANLTRPGRVHLGDTIQLGPITTRAYTIAATISYDSRDTDVTSLEMVLRTAIYARIDELAKVSGAVTLFRIRSVMDVSGVENVTLTTPSADAAAVVGEIPLCGKNDTDVALTFTDLAP